MPSAEKKIIIHFRSTGDAPIMRRTKFKVKATQRFAAILDFLRKQL
jgi:ubiquitin-like protein ATG12